MARMVSLGCTSHTRSPSRSRTRWIFSCNDSASANGASVKYVNRSVDAALPAQA